MVKVIFGMMGSSVSKGSSRMATPEQVQAVLTLLKQHNIEELDTARVYNGGKSEELLGAVNASHSFAVSTKAPGFMPGSLTGDKIITSCNASLKALGQAKLDIFYFHGPDRQTPLEESCTAVNALYQEGKFQRFGVSNMRADEVQEVHDICQSKGYVLPAVYQGGFNPLLRRAEFALFPTLRKLNMAFYAYSPLGGGFFGRPIAELETPPQNGRMDQMKIFKDIYVNEESLKLLATLTNTCAKHDIRVSDATLRWFMHHSALQDQDGVILGASSIEQAAENLTAVEAGPLPSDVVQSFTDMWEGYKAKAVSYSV